MYKFSEPEMIAFALVLVRLSAFVVSWPVFGVESIPSIIKILFALILTMIVFPTIHWQSSAIDFNNNQLIWIVLREAFIGVSFGFIAKMFFMATRVAGDLISLSVGLSGAQLFNPAMGGLSSPIDQFFFSLAGLLYLSVNGHHLFLTGIIDTFRIVPIGTSTLSTQGFAQFGTMVQDIIVVGIKMSAPIVMAILIVNMVMGILGKTVPQVNVLVTSLAVNIMIGLIVLIISLPMMMGEMPNLMELSAVRLFSLVRSF